MSVYRGTNFLLLRSVCQMGGLLSVARHISNKLRVPISQFKFVPFASFEAASNHKAASALCTAKSENVGSRWEALKGIICNAINPLNKANRTKRSS